MKKIVLSILTALCLAMVAQAVPAYKGLISYTQPDGSVLKIRLHGDEFGHWVTDASGQLLEKDADGYYRPASEAKLSARRAAARMRRSAANAARRGPAKAGVASGQKHFLVILVEFSDVHFKDGAATAFDNLLNEQGYSTNGGHGSARDYYYDNSHGYFEPIFDVYGPVRLSENQAYYGGNDADGYDLRPEMAVIGGCQGLDGNIDFTQYDNDGDGEVDLVFMYYAGKGEADGGGDDCIWPHQWDLTSAGQSLTLDGKSINKYACTNEIVGSGALSGKMCGIGTACHEFGHAMGLPDFYDTDYEENGEAGGLYDYSLMCSGSYNENGRRPPYLNMEERILLGWLDASAILEFPASGTYSLTTVNDNVAYKSPTDKDGEYFVYECRSQSGWDTDIPEAGMIVYHVDKSDRKVSILNAYGNAINVTALTLWDSWEQYNSINENGSHPCFYIVPAGSQNNLNITSSTFTKFAFPGAANKTSFTARSWNGVNSVVELSSISYSNNTVSFYASVPSSTLNYNVIANPGNGSYTAGDSFSLSLVTSEAQPVSSVEWYFDDEPVTGNSITLPAGVHVVEAHLTLSNGEVKIVDLTITAN